MVLKEGRIVEYGERSALAADPRSTYRAMLAAGANAGVDERLERMGV